MNPSVFLTLLLLLASPVLAADGPALYKEYCARCHGDSGRANNWRGYLYFARNFSDGDWQRARSDTQLLDSINKGPRIMPAYANQLTETEKEALIAVMRSFGPRTTPP
ncbi:MAG: cytochrome c [Moraxellaceae bacterium]|nr:cytochrome c [Moraxellaceae bacterium]